MVQTTCLPPYWITTAWQDHLQLSQLVPINTPQQPILVLPSHKQLKLVDQVIVPFRERVIAYSNRSHGFKHTSCDSNKKHISHICSFCNDCCTFCETAVINFVFLEKDLKKLVYFDFVNKGKQSTEKHLNLLCILLLGESHHPSKLTAV